MQHGVGKEKENKIKQAIESGIVINVCKSQRVLRCQQNII